MEIKRIISTYFSATGTTRKVADRIAERLRDHFDPSGEVLDSPFTYPGSRKREASFGRGDLVVFGVPTYAGRVPNILLPYLNEMVKGGGAIAVPVVTFGNRNYDDSLIELAGILEQNGFSIVSAGAFSCEHAFSYELGKGRPDEKDLEKADGFADRIAAKLESSDGIPEKPMIKGEDPLRPYYTPRDRDGNGIDIRKVKPETGPECDVCGICAEACPMGSINRKHPARIEGICIKCGACVKKCPKKCKYFDDEGYLYHLRELEDMYSERKEPELFL